MRFPFIIFVFILVLISCRKDDIVQEKFGYDIVLIMGQSNTHFGYGNTQMPENNDTNIVQMGRFEGHNMEIIPAQTPLDHHSKQADRMGFGMTFAHLYQAKYANKNRKLLLIPCGQTGSAFIKGNWKRGDLYYEDALARTLYILQNYPTSELKVILWHQGESDLWNSNYEANLDEFIANFRTDLDHEDLPIILGGMVPFWAESSEGNMTIQSIINDTPNRVSNTHYMDPTKPFRIVKEKDTVDQIHYDYKGQIELGKRYFEIFNKLE